LYIDSFTTEALRLKIRRFHRLEELVDLVKSLFQKDAEITAEPEDRVSKAGESKNPRSELRAAICHFDARTEDRRGVRFRIFVQCCLTKIYRSQSYDF
jgi:hypothetical protein